MNMQKIQTKLGLSLPAILLLAALPLPRAIGHDLQLFKDGDLINTILVFLPALVWLIVIFWKKVPKPFMTMLVIGLFYGIFLAITHQITWESFWNGNPPHLEGNLKDQFSPLVETLIMRAATFVSSVFVGVVTGGFVGAIATGGLYLFPQGDK
jgi:hypothetical protein